MDSYITYHDEIPDVETYFELRSSVDWSVFCGEQSEKALNNSYYCVVAKDGDSTVAMGRVVGDGMYCNIVDVMVKPQYQGKKIGSTIINKLVERIDEGTPEGGKASIQLIAASGKEGFYVKQGFTILPNEDSGPALRKLIYK